MKRNVTSFHTCYGCGVCAASCAKNIITIELNRDEFYVPYIKELDNCNNCGICLDVCAFNSEKRTIEVDEFEIKSWAAWSNDEEIRKRCFSGGIVFEIGKQLIEQGYKAIGCRYNIEKKRAEYYIASTFEECGTEKTIVDYREDVNFSVENLKNLRGRQDFVYSLRKCSVDFFKRISEYDTIYNHSNV